MAKVKVVLTHEEYGEFDIGDVPHEMFAHALLKDISDYTLSDMNADWRKIKVEIDGKEYSVL